MISMQQSAGRHFGVHSEPVCAQCGWQMCLTRRSPHPLYGNAYEQQTFECRACKLEVERSADGNGLPHG
jgi:hypothetical protein